MARLPNPGEDAGQWGAILNEFLAVAHDSSGALRDTYVRTVNSTAPDGNGNVIVTGGSGTTDHGALTGLGDDDHPQYHNDARGDARYFTQAQVNTALATKQATGQYIDSPTITHIVQTTAANYGSITPDASTLYVVVG